MYVLLLFLIHLLLLRLSTCQNLVSPCPTLFKYEPPNGENDRWYGVLTLINDSELSGIWLRLVFDKPSLQLGNWFGAEIVTTDHIEYLVKQPKFKLKANQPTYVRIFVKYNPNEEPPKLVAFRLNARTVCPISEATTPEPSTSAQLITSPELTTTTVAPPVPIIPEQTNENNEGNDTYENAGQHFQIFTSHGATQSVNLKVQCGTVKVKPRPLITRAEATYDGEFPWHTALFEREDQQWVYICGGSLINSKYVLTVAHCVVKRNPEGSKDPKDLAVHFGKHKLSDNSKINRRIQERQISEIIVHEGHDIQTLKQDIALLKLKQNAVITDYVRPVCLWDPKYSSLNDVIGKLGTLVGWGFNENGHVSEVLGKAKQPIVAQETCIFSYPEFYSQFTSNRTFCAGFRNGTSACNGDSGGGMVFAISAKNSGAIHWQLRGLVSVSVALPNESKCDPSQYVIFTDVAQYLDWIKAAIKRGG